MKKSHSRVLAAATALVAGGLAAFALKPAQAPSSQAVASRNPAAEVRTQVIRRTIHITRHQPAAGAGSHGLSALAGHSRWAARSGASGSHAGGSVSGAVATRASGSHAAGAAASGAPVSTRTSGSSVAATGSGTAVRTRTSGAAGSGGKPTTRSSGGHGEGGDGGGD